ncbi:MAG TPA: cupredoxin family copper-binding protein [Gammaproteobacteria bacterium]|nr:cupredoxin family copper-binding protein [Gammaproteobacteria bacterium]
MNDYILAGRGVAVTLFAAVMMSAPAIAFAGPGCVKQQNAYRGYNSYNPIPPQFAHWQARQYWYPAAPAAHAGWVNAPYQRPAYIQPRSPAVDPVANADPVSVAQATAGDDSKAAAETITVRISGMRFEPANLTVKPGTTVTWVMNDQMPHTITGQGNDLRSNTLQARQSYSFTFNESGRYDYACDFHPSMQGVVKVMKNNLDT